MDALSYEIAKETEPTPICDPAVTATFLVSPRPEEILHVRRVADNHLVAIAAECMVRTLLVSDSSPN